MGRIFDAKSGDGAAALASDTVSVPPSSFSFETAAEKSAWSIQSRSIFTLASLRGSPPIGILGASVTPRTRFIRRLEPLAPGTIAGPDAPPLKMAVSESRRSLPIETAPLWHFPQDCCSKGAICFSNSGLAVVWVFASWAACAEKELNANHAMVSSAQEN